MEGEAQSSGTVLLVRPAAFGFHAEAAATNAFASSSPDAGVRAHAIREVERLANRLTAAGVRVLTLEDSAEPGKPDAVFPNNWVSFHADGTMLLYPMATERRRLERDSLRVTRLLGASGLELRRTIDLSAHEEEGRYLEGTGSLILDRPRRRAYANRSPRTNPEAVADFDRRTGYSTLLFDARDPNGKEIYHTNVLMSLGTGWAILCVEAIAEADRARVIGSIEESGRTIIEVSFAQLRRFACNIIELRSSSGEPLVAMSAAALGSLEPAQRRALESFATLVAVPVPTIEAVGGGSVRCMIADVHLPPAMPAT